MYVSQAHVDLFRNTMRSVIMETTMYPWTDVLTPYVGYFLTPYSRCDFQVMNDRIAMQLVDLPAYRVWTGTNKTYIPHLQQLGRHQTSKQIDEYICTVIRYGFTRHLMSLYHTCNGLTPSSLCLHRRIVKSSTAPA